MGDGQDVPCPSPPPKHRGRPARPSAGSGQAETTSPCFPDLPSKVTVTFSTFSCIMCGSWWPLWEHAPKVEGKENGRSPSGVPPPPGQLYHPLQQVHPECPQRAGLGGMRPTGLPSPPIPTAIRLSAYRTRPGLRKTEALLHAPRTSPSDIPGGVHGERGDGHGAGFFQTTFVCFKKPVRQRLRRSRQRWYRHLRRA